MATNEDDAAIVRSTIDLATNLGLFVVAEGVGGELVWTQLANMGATTAQGYFLSRPMPAEKLVAWARQWELQRSDATLVA